MSLLSVVVPCFNEEDNIVPFFQSCCTVLEGKCSFEMLYVDDGSTDGTLKRLESLAESDHRVKYISLSRNSGHQNAIKAGLDNAIGECVVTIDVDGQQPVELIPEMLNLWNDGYEVVYTLREDDARISLFKRATSYMFYRINGWLSDVKVSPGAADFRLLDRKAVNALRRLPECDLFWRGLVSWIGFKQVALPYKVKPRRHGCSKYTLRKMMNLAFSGVTSFSTRPLRVSLLFGLVLLGISMLYAAYILVVAFVGNAVSGWPSLAFLIIFFGSLQFLFLGIMGEYIGKIFMENKKRPCYFVSKTNIPENENS